MNRNFVLFTATGLVRCVLPGPPAALPCTSGVACPEPPAAWIDFLRPDGALSPAVLPALREGPRPIWPGLAAVAAIAVPARALWSRCSQGRLVSNPTMGPSGLVLYSVTALGNGICPAAHGLPGRGVCPGGGHGTRGTVPFHRSQRRALLVGFILGGIAQPRFPLVAPPARRASASWGGASSGAAVQPAAGAGRGPAGTRPSPGADRGDQQQDGSYPASGRAPRTGGAPIRSSFDYFTVAVFLVSGDELVLRASTHRGGLGVHQHVSFEGGEGRHSRVGCRDGTPPGGRGRQPRSAVRFMLDPVMTKSELAVPILRRDRVVGVLDVQSSAPHAFTQRTC